MTANTINFSELLAFTSTSNFELFKLDLVAILFDVFIKVGERELVSMEKYELARDYLFELNTDLFMRVQKERFNNGCALIWHEIVNQTVAQTKSMLTKYFTPDIDFIFVPQLEHIIDSIDEVSGQKSIHKFVFEFATIIGPKIEPAWCEIKIMGETIPEDEKLNKITIGYNNNIEAQTD